MCSTVERALVSDPESCKSLKLAFTTGFCVMLMQHPSQQSIDARASILPTLCDRLEASARNNRVHTHDMAANDTQIRRLDLPLFSWCERRTTGSNVLRLRGISVSTEVSKSDGIAITRCQQTDLQRI
mmetsp:Transcript_14346/g.28622  ORF Transcript_14346/g.28622 Transcript_14346/m.28622 type:complete len:127 (-) Transcript_14346:161-541(-)